MHRCIPHKNAECSQRRKLNLIKIARYSERTFDPYPGLMKTRSASLRRRTRTYKRTTNYQIGIRMPAMNAITLAFCIHPRTPSAEDGSWRAPPQLRPGRGPQRGGCTGFRHASMNPKSPRRSEPRARRLPRTTGCRLHLRPSCPGIKPRCSPSIRPGPRPNRHARQMEPSEPCRRRRRCQS